MDRPATDVRVSESPAANESDYDFNSLAMVDSDGWPLQVSRYPGRSALLDVDHLRASEERYGTVSATLLTISAGESMRVDFGDTESATSVVEYIVARAPLGESGPVYRLTFTRDSGAPAVGDDALISEIIESFTLLGAGGKH